MYKCEKQSQSPGQRTTGIIQTNVVTTMWQKSIVEQQFYHSTSNQILTLELLLSANYDLSGWSTCTMNKDQLLKIQRECSNSEHNVSGGLLQQYKELSETSAWARCIPAIWDGAVETMCNTPPPFSRVKFPLLVVSLYFEPFKSYTASKLTIL